jgi:hypothetical protein
MAGQRVLWLTVVLALGGLISPDAAMPRNLNRRVPKRPAASLFHKVLPEIKSKTRVPILLPSDLPAPLKEKDIHLVVGEGEAGKYEVSLYYDEPGMGANFVGYFAGERGGSPLEFGKKVALSNGMSGYFRATSCGGSCSAPQMEWSQNGVLYTLQLRLDVDTEQQEERAMTSAANSAIQGGAR